MVFTEPIHNKTYTGTPFYVGNGLLHTYYNGTEFVFESRAANHRKNEPDGIYNMCIKWPNKYKVIVIDTNLPKVVAEAQESALISWEYDILGLKYGNSGLKIKEGETRNKKRESLEGIDFYLNIPRSSYASK